MCQLANNGEQSKPPVHRLQREFTLKNNLGEKKKSSSVIKLLGKERIINSNPNLALQSLHLNPHVQTKSQRQVHFWPLALAPKVDRVDEAAPPNEAPRGRIITAPLRVPSDSAAFKFTSEFSPQPVPLSAGNVDDIADALRSTEKCLSAPF